MTENSSSKSNLNREDSFSDLGDILGERAETFSTSSQMTDNDDINFLNRKIDILASVVRQLKSEKIEAKKDIDTLNCELKKLKEVKACFLKVSNKWKVSYVKRCCASGCVNNNTNATCASNFGFIQIISNTNVKYNCKPYYDCNNEARIFAENCFKQPESTNLCLNCSNYILYYYEIKLQIEGSKPMIEIGLRNFPLRNINFCVSGGYICYFDNNVNKTKFINLSSSFSFNNEDIIGCGVVWPNINNKLPYIFFTKNGELIAIEMRSINQTLFPFVNLKFCSIEANFGEDLNSKPFKYDITNHIVIEEFYKEEDFTDE